MLFEGDEYTKVPGFDHYYICNETTEIISIIKRQNEVAVSIKKLQLMAAKDHYYRTQFVLPNGKLKNVTVHRLMALTFIPNPENKAHVNHKDGNKLNNELCNLEWNTPKENAQHAVDTGLTTHEHCKVAVLQFSKDGSTFIAEFESGKVAEDITGVAKQNISKVLRGIRPRAGGFVWKYKK